MARSKNKRKNGKTVHHNEVKRMRTMASYDLKDLMICNAVDRKEIDGDRTGLEPRTVVYNRKLEKIVPITRLQEVALKRERWNWSVYMAIICRKQDGEVYITREENFDAVNEYFLADLNEYIADRLIENFQKANQLQALTMVWIATPYDMPETVPLRAVLAPLYAFNVLGNMLTRYETERPELEVLHYKADTFAEFVRWFLFQNKYRQRLEEKNTVEVWFEPTGTAMQKGELQRYRKRLVDLGCIEVLIGCEFKPLATPNGFAKERLEFKATGKQEALLMTYLDTVPRCLHTYVKRTFEDGQVEEFRFIYEGRNEQYGN